MNWPAQGGFSMESLLASFYEDEKGSRSRPKSELVSVLLLGRRQVGLGTWISDCCRGYSFPVADICRKGRAFRVMMADREMEISDQVTYD